MSAIKGLASPRLLCYQARAVRCQHRLEEALELFDRCIPALAAVQSEAPTPQEAEAFQRDRAATQQELSAGKQPSPPQVDRPDVAPSAPPSSGMGALAAVRAEPGVAVKDAGTRKVPVYRRPWFWTVTAGGLALAAGAVTLGVLLSRPDPPTEKMCSEGIDSCSRNPQSSQVAVGRIGSPRRRACSEPARRAANEVWTYFWSRSLKDQAVRPLQRSSREFFSQPDGGFLRSLNPSLTVSPLTLFQIAR